MTSAYPPTTPHGAAIAELRQRLDQAQHLQRRAVIVTLLAHLATLAVSEPEVADERQR